MDRLRKRIIIAHIHYLRYNKKLAFIFALQKGPVTQNF